MSETCANPECGKRFRQKSTGRPAECCSRECQIRRLYLTNPDRHYKARKRRAK